LRHRLCRDRDHSRRAGGQGFGDGSRGSSRPSSALAGVGLLRDRRDQAVGVEDQGVEQGGKIGFGSSF
jgi:hypothetical protein